MTLLTSISGLDSHALRLLARGWNRCHAAAEHCFRIRLLRMALKAAGAANMLHACF
jgi:hypothetical protein